MKSFRSNVIHLITFIFGLNVNAVDHQQLVKSTDRDNSSNWYQKVWPKEGFCKEIQNAFRNCFGDTKKILSATYFSSSGTYVATPIKPKNPRHVRRPYLFILDFDETLCASNWIYVNLRNAGLDIFEFVLQDPVSNTFQIPEEIMKDIRFNEDAALDLIKAAMKKGHVAIVSNGLPQWLKIGMQILYPRLYQLCQYLDVMTEEVFYPEKKVLLISARSPFFDSEQSKIPIAQALLKPLQDDIEVWSIGDSEYDLSNVEYCLKATQKFTGKKMPEGNLDPRALAEKLVEIRLALPAK